MVIDKLFKKWKWLGYVESGLLIVIGILVMAFYANPKFQSVIGYLVGVYLLINSLVLVISSLVYDIGMLDGDFISGLILLTLAVWLFVDPLALTNSLPLILGVIMIGYGIVMATKGCLAIGLRANVGKNIAILVSGCLLVACGISIISLQYSGSTDVGSFILLILGLVMTIGGLFGLADTLYVSIQAHKVKKDVKKAVDDHTIDVIPENKKEK